MSGRELELVILELEMFTTWILELQSLAESQTLINTTWTGASDPGAINFPVKIEQIT